MTENNGLLVAAANECGGSYTGMLKEIAALDSHTVKFTLCNVDPAFEAKLAFAAFQIAPREYIESTGGTGDLIDKPIGTGPYKLEAWNRGESIVLVRNEDYWGDKAIPERLIISPRTVHAHLRAIYGKLGVTNRSAATRFALEQGLA